MSEIVITEILVPINDNWSNNFMIKHVTNWKLKVLFLVSLFFIYVYFGEIIVISYLSLISIMQKHPKTRNGYNYTKIHHPIYKKPFYDLQIPTKLRACLKLFSSNRTQFMIFLLLCLWISFLLMFLLNLFLSFSVFMLKWFF